MKVRRARSVGHPSPASASRVLTGRSRGSSSTRPARRRAAIASATCGSPRRRSGGSARCWARSSRSLAVLAASRAHLAARSRERPPRASTCATAAGRLQLRRGGRGCQARTASPARGLNRRARRGLARRPPLKKRAVFSRLAPLHWAAHGPAVRIASRRPARRSRWPESQRDLYQSSMGGSLTLAMAASAMRICGSFALLAQLVEHFHGKEGVIGSSPIEGFPRTLGVRRGRFGRTQTDNVRRSCSAVAASAGTDQRCRRRPMTCA